MVSYSFYYQRGRMYSHKNCSNCQTLPSISRDAGDLLVSCDVPELCTKFSLYLEKRKFTACIEDTYTLWIHVDSFEPFLTKLLEDAFFDEIEQKAISFLFLPNGTPFTPSKIREAKTLFKYKDLINAQGLANLISKGTLTTHFQPIVNLENDEIYGYETLVRGVDECGTLIYPNQLFKWAREGDMLFFLDRACRESSLKTAAVKNIQNKVFINFVPTAIYDPEHCLASTVQWAKQLNFNPKNIIFEVIESDHVSDIAHLKKILDFYKSQGFMVALDDVGSGYSSLNMLSKLAPDIIKIDREIMDYIDTNTANQSIFKAIVSIAKENEILVLAEGVERVEEVAFACAHGAHLAQGYYFGKPTAEPIRRLLHVK